MVIDVSRVIKKSGTYEFAFVYSKGQNGTDIHSAALYQGNKKIALDDHKGFSGGHLHNVVYSLKVASYDPKAKYLLKADVKGNGGKDTYGEVKFVGVR